MMVKVLLIILIVLICLFLLSLIIYFFNLDMKLAAAMIPIMNKIYDRGKAKREKKAAKAQKSTGTVRKETGKESNAEMNGDKMNKDGSEAESA